MDTTKHTRRAPQNSELFRPILNANKSRLAKTQPAIRATPKNIRRSLEKAGMNLISIYQDKLIAERNKN